MRLVALIIGCLVAPCALAAGLALVDFQSVSAFGVSGAGRGVNSSDASVISANPAGMVLLDREQLVIGGFDVFAGGEAYGEYQTPATQMPKAGIKPSSVVYYETLGSRQNYRDCTGIDADLGICYAESGKVSDYLHPAVVPALYYAKPLADDLWGGVAVYASFGGESHYPEASPFRYQALSSKAQVVVVQPTLSWQYDHQLAFGAGLQLSLGKMAMSRMINPWANAATDARADIKGTGLGGGATLGMLWKPIDTVTLGLSYHSPVTIRFKGEMEASGVAGLGVVLEQYGSSDGSSFDSHPESIDNAYQSARWMMEERPATTRADIRSRMTFPEYIDISGSWALTEQWTLKGSAIWTRWSRLDKIRIVSHGTIPGRNPVDIVSVSNGDINGNTVAQMPLEWSDSWNLSLGAHYQVNDQLTLRFGVAEDDSPISGHTRSPRIPDSDRHWLTIGAGYRFDDSYTLDVAYGCMFMKSFALYDFNHKVDGSRQGMNVATGLYEDPGTIAARYRNVHAHAVAAQLTVRF